MLLSVKILKGGGCDIEVSATASIISVKELVAQQLRIPVDQQTLVFKGKTLLDSETLCDYNIVEGNKLHLFVREDSPETHEISSLDIYEGLHKVFEKHFGPFEAAKVSEELRKNFCDQMRHVSLDDIERIATLHVDATNTIHHSQQPPPPPEASTPMQS